eukprot:78214_1
MTTASPNDCVLPDNNLVIKDKNTIHSIKIDCALPIIHAGYNPPSPVLKRRNSKSWTSLDFNLYEKELSDQMKLLDQQNIPHNNRDMGSPSQPLPQRQKVKTHCCDKRPISRSLTNCRQLFHPLSPINCHQWSSDQMIDYESE